MLEWAAIGTAVVILGLGVGLLVAIDAVLGDDH